MLRLLLLAKSELQADQLYAYLHSQSQSFLSLWRDEEGSSVCICVKLFIKLPQTLNRSPKVPMGSKPEMNPSPSDISQGCQPPAARVGGWREDYFDLAPALFPSGPFRLLLDRSCTWNSLNIPVSNLDSASLLLTAKESCNWAQICMASGLCFIQEGDLKTTTSFPICRKGVAVFTPTYIDSQSWH